MQYIIFFHMICMTLNRIFIYVSSINEYFQIGHFVDILFSDIVKENDLLKRKWNVVNADRRYPFVRVSPGYRTEISGFCRFYLRPSFIWTIR